MPEAHVEILDNYPLTVGAILQCQFSDWQGNWPIEWEVHSFYDPSLHTKKEIQQLRREGIPKEWTDKESNMSVRYRLIRSQ